MTLEFDDLSGNGKGVLFIPGAGRFGPGISEAPNDGENYVRNSGSWIEEGVINNDTLYGEVTLEQFYASDVSTDDDAFLAFADAFNAGTLSNCRLVLHPSKGRGNLSTGNYFLSQEILFTGPYRLEIDGGGSFIRLTNAAARLRYKPPPYGGANFVPYPYFVVKNFTVQYGAAVDCFAYWDIPYNNSRIGGTGYAENIRTGPQNTNDSTHTIQSMFRCKNTWAFTAFRCHHTGKARVPTDLVNYPNVVFIRQDGVCVVTDVLACEINYVYQPVGIGVGTITGINGSFAPVGATPFQKGNKVVQSGNTGYLGRSDGGYGYTYGLYDVVGTFTTGTAQVYDFTGVTVIGTLTITTTAVYQQASEALSFDSGTAVATCCYGFKWTKPAQVQDNFLNTVFGNCHFAPSYKIIEADGVSAFAISDKANFLPAIASTTGLIDINNGYLIHIGACTATNNGVTTSGFIKLRNTQVFSVSGCKLSFFNTPINLDNTCKNGSVDNLVCDPNVGLIANTANRFNGTSLQGVRFRNNGHVGLDIDIDDGTLNTWIPTVTASMGTITSWSALGTYVLANGHFTFTLAVQIINRGSADGSMKITLPNSIDTASGITLPDATVNARNSNGPAFPMMGFVGVNALGGGLRGILLEHQNPAYSAFTNYAGTFGSYNYIISGSVPVRLN